MEMEPEVLKSPHIINKGKTPTQVEVKISRQHPMVPHKLFEKLMDEGYDHVTGILKLE